jgi:hypothetical protein
MNERLCLDCGSDLAGKRADAQFCDGTCKKRWQRKEARRLAAEEGDSSVVWDGSECATNTEPVPKLKKPSTSPTVLLKQRVKERILRKGEAPSSTCQTEIPQGTDVPPVEAGQVFLKTDFQSWEPYIVPDPDCVPTGKMHPVNLNVETPPAPKPTTVSYEDATAGLPPEALPEKLMNPIEAMHKRILRAKAAADEEGVEIVTEKHLEEADRRHGPYHPYTPLPIEHHGTQNDLARQIIAKVPAPKLDPNSDEAELARLLKHQMPVKKKGGES